MPVMINLDALEDNKQLRGEVTKVNQYAEPSGFGGGGVKEYGVLIRIFDPPAEIRPGMNAAVKIVTDQRAMALQVPLQSVYEYRGHHFCLLKVGNEWETREVVISATNDTKAVVEKGLAKGDEVILSPRRYKDKMDLPNLPDPAAPKNAPAKRSGKDATASPSDARPNATPPKGPPSSAGQGGGQGRGGDPSQFFAGLDSNGDGKLTSDEMGSIRDGLRSRLSGADSDGDGDISKAEFTAAMQKLRSGGGGRPGSGGGGGGGRPGGPGR